MARAQLAGRTLAERTCSQFGEHWARGGPAPGPAIIWLTEPDSFQDCIHFWNMRALRPLRLGNVPMLPLPIGQVQHGLHFAGELARALERPDQFAPDVALCSFNIPKADLHQTASLLELQPHDGEPRSTRDWPVPTRKPPLTYRVDLNPRQWLNFERAYGEVTNVDVQLFRTPPRSVSRPQFRSRQTGPPSSA